MLMFTMVLTMSLPLSLTSCSNDDDEEGGGSSSKITLKVDGQSADFGYVYWNIDKEQSQNGKNYYQLEFWSFDFYNNKRPSKMSMFYLGFYAEGSESVLPTGTFNDYDLSGALNFSLSNPEGLYIEEDENKSGNLVVTKDGDNYTVSIEPLYILSGEGDFDTDATSTLTTFKYTGKIPKAPKKSWED